MKLQLIQYLENKNTHNPAEFDFRLKCNTFQGLNIFSTDGFTHIDDKHSELCIFTDFDKAFDTVNHKILLNKMHHYGTHGPLLS